MNGSVHAIGLGPGDPELITVKGLRLLREADVVFIPATREGRSFAGSIVSGYLETPRQQIVELVCPPYRERTAVEKRWTELAAVVAAHLSTGEMGAFVCEGDPSLYGTFLHLRRGLERCHPEIAIAVIPGITSISASAALAGYPLATWDERLLISPAAHDASTLSALLGVAESLAILKPGQALPALVDAVASRGDQVRAVLVRRAGRPDQEVVSDPAAMRLVTDDYFTTLLVRRQP